MDKQMQSLIYQAIDGEISESDFERLQDAILHDDEVRDAYIKAVGLCESLSEISADASIHVAVPAESRSQRSTIDRRSRWPLTSSQLAIAATVLILFGGAAFWLGKSQPGGDVVAEQTSEPEEAEPQIFGHATLRRALDLKWPDEAERRREGDVLPNGTFAFEDGVAEIDFFCGATLIVEGPAQLFIESDWSVSVTRGRLRASVPPAARGFVVNAAGSEIVDLGTEFVLEVSPDAAQVEVVDGEIELRGGTHDGKRLVTGEGESLLGSPIGRDSLDQLSTVEDIQQRQLDAESKRFALWKEHVDQIREDGRIIAYFPIAASQDERVVRNFSPAGKAFDGLIVGPVDRTEGRFGTQSSGLEFDRPGSRVRTRIDGEFEAFTFAGWVRIDSLEHRYNALFMADSYENGEPHWQIRDDGSLMFSVMVDDTQEILHYSPYEKGLVRQAGLHRVYYTDPIWDLSKSGQWLHLAAVYDPINRRVEQFVNGERVSSESIIDKFYITDLRIGPAEIGNWGQPFRESPWFAVRNLNGTIDEIILFNAALSDEEIKELYELGKPLGY